MRIWMKRIIFCIKKLSVIFIFSVVSVHIFPINLRLLNGTVAPLTQPEQKYALFRGVSYAEGVAENLYNLSDKDIQRKVKQEIADSKQPADEIVEPKARVEKFLNEMPESATSKLVSQMFHRAGGQFQLTEAPNNPVRQLSPKNMGEILKIIAEVKLFAQPKGQLNLEFSLETYLEKLNLKKGSGTLFKRKDFKSFVSSLVNSLSRI